MSRWGEAARWRVLTYVFLSVALILISLQVWSAISARNVVIEARRAAAMDHKDDIDLEKARQELIGRRIDNDSKGVVQTVLAGGVSTLAAALVTIAGAMLALRNYLDAQDRDRRDRADARDKDRVDRLGGELKETLTRLVSSEWRERVVGAAGMLSFFTQERADYHLPVLAALIAATRIQDELPEVRQGIRLAVERAMRSVAPDLLAQMSWQGVKLPSINLVRCDLTGLDLRDTVLENARMDEAILDRADLTAAALQGASLRGASLRGTTLTYADLAGASLTKAHLNGASIEGVKVLNADFQDADLRDIALFWRGVPWDATRNWRDARFDPAVRKDLDQLYGPSAPAFKVLMLMWEIPPLVAGGTWTACYHLVRNLRRRGLDVTIVVPWARDQILPMPFGSEVRIDCLGIALPDGASASSYASAAPSWSPYSRGAPSAYGGWSPYGGGAAPFWSTYTSYSGRSDAAPYGFAVRGGIYGSYQAGASGPSAASLAGSILFRLIGEFRRRLEDYVRDHPTDLIHAHDWVTFDAARAAARVAGAPWFAHFHSTEAERQPDGGDPLTERIEQSGADNATHIIVPGETTRKIVIAKYGPAPAKIDAIPNVLSEGPALAADMGRFETRRVVFLGRLSQQKGVDRFCAVAEAVRRLGLDVRFEAFGDGEQRGLLAASGVTWRGPLGWDQRGQAFRGASIVLVPSRAEPFGMVILEAMQHRVPVIYPKQSGAAEVLRSGNQLDPGDIQAVADQITHLLASIETWESATRAEAAEIEAYPARSYEDRLIAAWTQAVLPAPRVPGA